MAMLACLYAFTASQNCDLTSLSYNQVASVIGSVKNDKTEQLCIGKQGDGISEDEKRTEVKVTISRVNMLPLPEFATVRPGKVTIMSLA